MKAKMQAKDTFNNALTYISAGLGVLILGSILVFVLSKGLKGLNFDLIKSNYWSENYLATVEESYQTNELNDEHSSAQGYYSTKWGIAIDDTLSAKGEKQLEVTYVSPNSPFAHLLNATAGENFEKPLKMHTGYTIEKIDYMTADGTIGLAGKILAQDAKTTIETLDKASTITSVYFKSAGGGIRGSLIATFYLIVISLTISLPIGIASAIYLKEYAGPTKINSLIRQGIETLTGVPSIVYGLMGITVLFPVTQLVGATTTSILLGGLTMAVILLPTIIRSTEEALLVVPKSLRDASLSLGATQSQTIFKVVLPCCINGILTGVLLGIGRVIGESAALIYTMGTFINDNPTILSQGTSLALMIWSFMSGENPNFELASTISIIILAIVLVLNIIVKLIGKRFAKQFV
ncbi:MAG: phosphate ABC transporter permease PstA [Erysipelotrichaceae bacterium]|nr:phosphate ABC transporter permease PstA [Erysipelotrichaceae bacterium]